MSIAQGHEWEPHLTEDASTCRRCGLTVENTLRAAGWDEELVKTPCSEQHSAATVSDFCECGHQRHQHVSFEREGACTGKRDTRHVTVGGPELTPCDCKQFKPLGWSNVRV